MLKRIVWGLALAGLATAATAQVYHEGYTRRDGTYVAPHYQSPPDGNPYNNYSTQGNVNPYTGQPGTVNPYNQGQYGSSYNQNTNRYGQYGSSYGH